MFKKFINTIHSWIKPKKETETKTKPAKQNPEKTCKKPQHKPRRKVPVKYRNRSFYKYYSAYDRRYFKTDEGKAHIDITADEALKIIDLSRSGIPNKEIINKIDWEHNITGYTVENWIKIYNLGLMDIALSWICDNHVDGITVNKKNYLHKFNGDLK